MSSVSRVVFDLNVLVGAALGGNSPFRSWPSPPPTTDNPHADCLGIVNDAREWSLWLSPRMLQTLAWVLADDEDGPAWEPDVIEEYVEILVEIADASGGGVVEPAAAIGDCADNEDNEILAVALETGADLIVSDDAHLLDMSPWRGAIPVVRPAEFRSRVDMVRRRRS